ncbi:heme ABC transporter substrate-binding protein IsdE [Caryophanon tenue]|uniref:High-affinity heme uptake system protein IsdE n=1 Tax=Caryophanon tenue TaxID=33978 RepID=A0A1C0YN08_9BACL|nr:heme ABC transporter substrate-binding protein IsdE [Caryophanon tenue]OCS88560.1 heme ABC transporter substrate-binding protein IsdE [Caryophanon tenue]
MKKWYIFCVLSVMIFALAACSSEVVVDEQDVPAAQTGEQRVVAATSVVANILDLLEMDNVIAVPETSVPLPARYESLPTIGNAMNPDMETLAAMKPTDVISVTTLQNDLEGPFKAINAPATFMNLQSIEAMKRDILMLGDKYDRLTQAKKVTDALQAEIDAAVATVPADAVKPKILILLGVPGSYLVATDQSYIGNITELAGGENVMGDFNQEYLASNTEYLHEANPDIILRLAHGMPDEVIAMFDEEFQTNDIWKHFNAVKNDRVYDLEEPLFATTANLDVAEAIAHLVNIFYEEE